MSQFGQEGAVPHGRGSRSLHDRLLIVALATTVTVGVTACSSGDAATSRAGALTEDAATSSMSRSTATESTTPTEPGTVPDAAPTTTEADGALWRTSAVGTLPEDFPPQVPLPPGHEVVVATESISSSPKSFVLRLVVPGEPHAVFDGVVAAFDAGGWEELQRSTENFGGSPTGTAVYSNGAILVNLGAIPGDDPGTTALTYSIVPAEPVVSPTG